MKSAKKRQAGEAVNRKDLEAAQDRLGVAPLARLDWALALAQRDLDRATVGDWANLRLELEAFTQPGHGVLLLRRWLGSSHAWLKQRLEKAYNLVDPDILSGALPIPSEDEVRRVQKEFHRIFSELIQKGVTVVAHYELDLYAGRVLTEDMQLRPFLAPKGLMEPSELAPYHLAAYLGMYAHLIRECPAPAPRGKGEACGAWFLARRAKQMYCSRNCQSRVTTQQYRAKKVAGEKGGVRRGAQTGRET